MKNKSHVTATTNQILNINEKKKHKKKIKLNIKIYFSWFVLLMNFGINLRGFFSFFLPSELSQESVPDTLSSSCPWSPEMVPIVVDCFGRIFFWKQSSELLRWGISVSATVKVLEASRKRIFEPFWTAWLFCNWDTPAADFDLGIFTLSVMVASWPWPRVWSNTESGVVGLKTEIWER